MENKLELRMFGLVPYNISPIQQGIQFGHAVVRYGRTQDLEQYNDWADNWQTFIILNGGTTNLNPDRLGTLNQHLQTLIDNGVFCVPFYEPDLGDQLTSIVFIVDERVFDKEKYPDYELETVGYSNEWFNFIGGEKNLFLREFLKQFRKA